MTVPMPIFTPPTYPDPVPAPAAPEPVPAAPPAPAAPVPPPPAPAGPTPILEGSFAIFRPTEQQLLLVWRKKESGPGLRTQVRELAEQMVGNLDGEISGYGQEFLALADHESTEQDRYLPIPPMVIQMAAQMGGLSLDDVVAKITNGDLS